MKESILRYLLTMGVIAAPTKAKSTASFVLQTPEQPLEKDLRSLWTVSKLVLATAGLTILGISMLPTVAKPVVLQGLLFLTAGFSNICDTLATGLLTALVWLNNNIDMSMFTTYW
jgi:hypothetical protein